MPISSTEATAHRAGTIESEGSEGTNNTAYEVKNATQTTLKQIPPNDSHSTLSKHQHCQTWQSLKTKANSRLNQIGGCQSKIANNLGTPTDATKPAIVQKHFLDPNAASFLPSLHQETTPDGLSRADETDSNFEFVKGCYQPAWYFCETYSQCREDDQSYSLRERESSRGGITMHQLKHLTELRVGKNTMEISGSKPRMMRAMAQTLVPIHMHSLKKQDPTPIQAEFIARAWAMAHEYYSNRDKFN
jgi:hypothetical protein